MRTLDVSRKSPEAQKVLDTLRKKVVGQREAIDVLVDIVENYQAGFAQPDRPAGNALFLGPTGSGKTHTVESLCKGLFGDERACIKIDCGEYQHGHEIAKLVGSPPGYLGHRETHPMLTQEALALFHTDKLKLSVLLFDEIEKASDTLWNLLLGILDKAQLTLGDNRKVDFSKVIILMTSNLGSGQMDGVTDGGIGYNSPDVPHKVLDEKIEKVAQEAAKRHFSPEFYNRLNHVCVFRTLTKEQIKEVLDIELGQLQTRLLFNSKVKFFWHVKKNAKATLLKEGFSKKYGARHMSRAIESRILSPLARLVASGQILENDVVIIDDLGKKEFSFELDEGRLSTARVGG
jgi:ATP-dependent Clp protease ATP-binding subunit ClpB